MQQEKLLDQNYLMNIMENLDQYYDFRLVFPQRNSPLKKLHPNFFEQFPKVIVFEEIIFSTTKTFGPKLFNEYNGKFGIVLRFSISISKEKQSIKKFTSKIF